MTEQQYEICADAISRNIWEISTNNGSALDEEFWHSHRQNCYAAVANTYFDGINVDDWQNAALERIGGAA